MFNSTQRGIEITQRYFLAISTLIEQKKIRGIGTIARECNYNRWNLVTLKNEPNRMLKPELIAHLIEKYNVSAEWVLLGRPPMFKL